MTKSNLIKHSFVSILFIFSVILVIKPVSSISYIYDDYNFNNNYNNYNFRSGFDPNLIGYYDETRDFAYGNYNNYRTGQMYGYHVMQLPNGDVELGHIREFTRSGTKYTVFIPSDDAPKVTHNNIEEHSVASLKTRTLSFANIRGYNNFRSEKRYYYCSFRYC